MEQLRNQLIASWLPRPLSCPRWKIQTVVHAPGYTYKLTLTLFLRLFLEIQSNRHFRSTGIKLFLTPLDRVGWKSRPQNTGKLRPIYPKTHPSEGFWIVRINKITNKMFDFHNLICGRFRVKIRCFWYWILEVISLWFSYLKCFNKNAIFERNL